MKKVTQILIVAFIGVVIVNTAKAQIYDPLAVQRINDLIANNGLQATPNAPETWLFAMWNDETPKQIIGLGLSRRNLTGTASFAGLTTLQELFCYENNLTELDVSNCTALQELQCGYNPLTKLNLTNCTNLQILVCGDNRLSELDITACTQLEQLIIFSNYFTTFDATNCKLLKGILCTENKLIEFDLTGLEESLKYFNGEYQEVPLTLYGNETGSYTLPINLNAPTFMNSTISYENGILESMDNTVASTSFTVKTIGKNYQLSGTMYFDYSNVGIQPQENEQLRIYPNPTTGKLHITGNRHCGLDPQSPENDEIAGQARNDIKNIEIFDVMGKSVYVETHCSASLQQPTTIFDISNLPAGIYFVKIITDTGVIVKKVVKQ